MGDDTSPTTAIVKAIGTSGSTRTTKVGRLGDGLLGREQELDGHPQLIRDELLGHRQVRREVTMAQDHPHDTPTYETTP
jgi:hypothetical protein